MIDAAARPADHSLARGLGLWQATAINITQVVGAGVFLTIPLILGVCPGPTACSPGWSPACSILADGMIWGELGAALPSAGGSYHFLLECYGRDDLGPADGVSVRLANPHQRAARSRLRPGGDRPVLDRAEPRIQGI